MICPICKCGQTKPGFASVTLERDAMTLLVKQVPALICENCGEEFIGEAASIQLLQTAETAMRNGVQVELRQFAAA
jgi:YgiT-type zinc finger domain-containing protein